MKLHSINMVFEIFNHFEWCGFSRKEFKNILMENPHSVLAGGSVANSILNIVDKTNAYPVNDLDIFLLSTEKNKPVIDSFQSKPDTTEEYLQIISPKLYMVGREVREDIDLVYMQLDYRYTWNDETLKEINFPLYVLNSFDLNCVEVGIFWNGENFELIWTREFEKFLETRKVEITNVHSMVTLPRAFKKAIDLQCHIDLREEFQMMWYGCNSRNLNKMTDEQREKHDVEISYAEVHDYLTVLEYSQPLHDEVYQLFFGTKLMGNRRDKIRLLRYFRNPNFTNFLCNSSPFYNEHLLYLSTFYEGELSKFFLPDSYSAVHKNILIEKNVNDFIGKTGILWPLKGMTLSEANEFVTRFENALNNQTHNKHTVRRLVVYLEKFLPENKLKELTIENLTDLSYLEDLTEKDKVVYDEENEIPF